jgi:hypothetical protein
MQAKRDYPVRRRKDHAMAKNKKWSKLVARIQALEDALAGLLSVKSPRKRKKSEAKPKAKPKIKSAAGKRKTAKPAKAAPRKTSRPATKTAKRYRRKSARAIVAENMPIVPGVPVGSL